MRDISKANFYKSYFLAGKKLNDCDRLSFYDTIFNYIFDEIEPVKLEYVVDLVFTTIKPFIDADLSRKAGGAPMGNQNAKKNKQPTNNPINNLQTNNVNVNDNVNEDENENVNEILTSENLTIDNIKNWAETNTRFKHYPKSLANLEVALTFLKSEKLPVSYLDYVFCRCSEKYDKKDINFGLITNALGWFVDDYKLDGTKVKKETSKIKIKPAPKSCTFCGTKLIMGGILNSWECPNCKPRTWWELSGDEWKCSRD